MAEKKHPDKNHGKKPKQRMKPYIVHQYLLKETDENHEPREAKWHTTLIFTSGENDFCIGSPCFLMHSGQKTTRPRDNSPLFINTFSPPRTRHFHHYRRPLARSPFFLGNSLHFVSLVLFSPPSFRRHRIVAQPRQWMRLHMLRLCRVD
jgi:hypothetical protein